MQDRIQAFVEVRLVEQDDPRELGKALRGKAFENIWRYRVGNCRILAEINDETVTILIVDAGHRSSIYG